MCYYGFFISCCIEEFQNSEYVFPVWTLIFLKQGERGRRGRSKPCQRGAPGIPGQRGDTVRFIFDHTPFTSINTLLQAPLHDRRQASFPLVSSKIATNLEKWAQLKHYCNFDANIFPQL